MLLIFLFISCITLCSTRSIGGDINNNYQILFYSNEFPLSWYSKETSLNDPKLLWNGMHTLAIEYYADKETLFWTTSSGELYSAPAPWATNNEVTIEKSMNTTINVTLLYRQKDWVPRSIALDYIGKKLYIVDTTERSIDVFDFNGTNKARLFKRHFLIPMEIVLDPSDGLIFAMAHNFYENSFQIYRINMDGTSPRLIVPLVEEVCTGKLDKRIGFTIDRANKRIYFQNSLKGIIESVNYYGSDRVINQRSPVIVSIDIHQNRLYWAESIADIKSLIPMYPIFSTFFNFFDDYQYVFRSCRLNDKHICDHNSTTETMFNYKHMIPDAFKVIDLFVPVGNMNLCAENNGGCQHHCLLKHTELKNTLDYGCLCRSGFQLNKDNATCSVIDEILHFNDDSFYTEQKVLIPYVTEVKFWFNARNDSIFPISKDFLYKLLFDGPHQVRDYNLNEKYEVNNDGALTKYIEDNNSTVILKNSTEKIANILTYDWVSKNLYYAVFNDNIGSFKLNVVNIKKLGVEANIAEIDSPTSMGVEPYRGYLFISIYNNTKILSNILRMNTNGKDPYKFSYSSNTKILLTIDLAEDKIYWIDGDTDENVGKRKFIKSSNFDGSNMKVVTDTPASRINSINIYDYFIFVKSDWDNQIYRYKRTGESSGQFNVMYVFKNHISNVYAITELKIPKTDTQYLSKKNPCMYDNGNCEMFCFSVPKGNSGDIKKVCGCSIGKNLTDDGIHCKT